MDIFLGNHGKQRAVESGADSPTGCIGMTGDTDFDGRVVGGFGAKPSGRSVANDTEGKILSYQKSIPSAIAMFAEPRDTLVGAKRPNVKGDMRIRYIVVVNLG